MAEPLTVAAPPSRPPPDRLGELLALVDDDGLTIPQAAARLGISRAKARRLYDGEVAG